MQMRDLDERVRKAVGNVVRDGKKVTKDLNAQAGVTTDEMAKAILGEVLIG